MKVMRHLTTLVGLLTVSVLPLQTVGAGDGEGGQAALQEYKRVKANLQAQLVARNAEEGMQREAMQSAHSIMRLIEEDEGLHSIWLGDTLYLLFQALGEKPGKSRDELRDFLVRRKESTQKERGVGHPGVMECVCDIACVEFWSDDNTAAERWCAAARQLLDLRGDAIGLSDARNLLRASLILSEIGVDSEAGYFAARAVEVCARNLKPDDARVAMALHLHAKADWNMGNYATAAPKCQQALEIREKALAKEELTPDDPDLAWSRYMRASIHDALGEYAEAEALLRKVTENELMKTSAPPPYVAAIAELGWCLACRGRFSEGQAKLEESICLGPEPSIYAASILGDEGTILTVLGDFVGARQRFLRASEIVERLSSMRAKEIHAKILNGTASLCDAMGDYRESLRLNRTAFEIREVLQPDHPWHGSTIGNLARTYYLVGNYDDAGRYAELARRFFDNHLGPGNIETVGPLLTMAAVMRRTGESSEATNLVRRALEIQEKTLGRGHPDIAHTLYVLASELADEGRYGEAEELFGRIQGLAERPYGYDHVIAGFFSRLAVAMGEYERAYSRCMGGLGAKTDHVRITARVLSEREALSYARELAVLRDIAVSLVAARLLPTRAKEVWGSVVDSRALVLEEMGARVRRVSGEEDGELAGLHSRLQRARERLAFLTVSRQRGLDRSAYANELNEAANEKERAERAIGQKLLGSRGDGLAQPAKPEEVLRALEGKDALVSYVRYEGISVGSPGGVRQPMARALFEERVSEGLRYAAFVARGGNNPTIDIVQLGNAEGIDKKVAEWQKEFGGDSANRAVGPVRGDIDESHYRHVGSELRRLIWDPIEERLAGAERVFIVPDGSVNLVNLSLLPVGAHEYLVERQLYLHVVGAERDLVSFCGDSKRGKGLLIVGAPAYDKEVKLSASSLKPPLAGEGAGIAEGGRSPTHDPPLAPTKVTSQLVQFKVVAGIREEMEEVRDVWQRSFGREGNGLGLGEDVTTLADVEASESALQTLASGRRVIHVATHGFFGIRVRAPTASVIDSRALAMDSREWLEPESMITSENPLVLSGLALAGANLRGSTDAQRGDGILTAEEVAGLDLNGVEWVVLSACQTGLGEVQSGEGVFGMRRAFRIAGARSLFVGLWSVGSNASREWIRVLYQRRFGTPAATTIEATRSACRTLLERRRKDKESCHPYYWGGFMASGDWR